MLLKLIIATYCNQSVFLARDIAWPSAPTPFFSIIPSLHRALAFGHAAKNGNPWLSGIKIEHKEPQFGPNMLTFFLTRFGFCSCLVISLTTDATSGSATEDLS